MSDISEIVDEVTSLENKIGTLEKVFISCTTDMLEALEMQNRQIAKLGEMVAMATSPLEEDQIKFKTLKEAYNKYEFVKKMTLGNKL